MAIIWAVCKDVGGTNGIVPVVEELERLGHDVCLIANGKAKEILPKDKLMSFGNIEELKCHIQQPKVLITSMCSGGGIGRDLVRDYCPSKGIPTVALQDFWGARLWDEWSAVRPDTICVNDDVGRTLVLRAWPDYHVTAVKVTGYPALDKYKSFDCGEAGKKVRNQFNIPPKRPIVLYAGQIEFAGSMLRELVAVLNGMSELPCLVARAHPRMKTEAPAKQSEKWHVAETEYIGQLIKDSSAYNMQTLIAASSVVVSGFSMALIEATVLRKPNISMLYLEMGMVEYAREMGHIGNFPLFTLGCSFQATCREALLNVLNISLSGDRRLEAAQRANFRLDGANAKRVAEVVCGLL